ncbi:hypothetical protein D3C72_1433130 [compost metagenome]
MLERVVPARDEAAQLFFAVDREPVFEHQRAAVAEHALQVRCLAHEFQVLQRRAKVHDALDTGTVVPGAVEEDHFTGGGQVLDIALEIPLALLLLGRLLQGDDTCAAWVQVLHEALDGTALTSCVTAFKEDDDALAGLLDPALHLEQFDLQSVLGLFVLRAAHAGAIGVAGGQFCRGAVFVRATWCRGDLQCSRLLADGTDFTVDGNCSRLAGGAWPPCAWGSGLG